ncbi:MAG: molybdenum cofactor guanylyltransferase [Thermoleophilia bacterium]
MPGVTGSDPGAADVVGVLLAGGSGKRLSLDKRYLVLHGQSLLRRNLDFLRERFARVVVSLAEGGHIDFGDAEAVEIVLDACPGRSPLAGIATVLTAVQKPVFAMAVDLARPDAAALERVLAAAAGRDLALPVVSGRYEPTFAVYQPACLPAMRDLLGCGEHRLRALLSRVTVAEVPFSGDDVFRNVNTREDFERARALVDLAPRDAVTAPAAVALVGSAAGEFAPVLREELVRFGLRVAGSVPGGSAWSAADQALGGCAPVVGRADIVLALDRSADLPHRVSAGRAGIGVSVAVGAGRHEARFAAGDAVGPARFLIARLNSLRDY